MRLLLLIAVLLLLAHGLIALVIIIGALYALRWLYWELRLIAWRLGLKHPRDRMEAQLLTEQYRASMRRK
jgi:hypothetical protein